MAKKQSKKEDKTILMENEEVTTSKKKSAAKNNPSDKKKSSKNSSVIKKKNIASNAKKSADKKIETKKTKPSTKKNEKKPDTTSKKTIIKSEKNTPKKINKVKLIIPDEYKNVSIDQVADELNSHSFLVYAESVLPPSYLKYYLLKKDKNEEELKELINEHNNQVYKQRALFASESIEKAQNGLQLEKVKASFFANPSNLENPYKNEVEKEFTEKDEEKGIDKTVIEEIKTEELKEDSDFPSVEATITSMNEDKAKTKDDNIVKKKPKEIIIGICAIIALTMFIIVIINVSEKEDKNPQVLNAKKQEKKMKAKKSSKIKLKKFEDNKALKKITMDDGGSKKSKKKARKKPTIVKKTSKKLKNKVYSETLTDIQKKGKPVRVVWGKTLVKIAGKEYNNPYFWPYIYFNNQNTITAPDKLIPVKDRVFITYKTNEDLGKLYFKLFMIFKEDGQTRRKYDMLKQAYLRNKTHVNENLDELSAAEKRFIGR